jgi:hypothetical protein
VGHVNWPEGCKWLEQRPRPRRNSPSSCPSTQIENLDPPVAAVLTQNIHHGPDIMASDEVAEAEVLHDLSLKLLCWVQEISR